MVTPQYIRRANQILFLVFVAFALAAAYRHYFPPSLGSKLLFAVTEAALVGGIADWFAVTALFRRPLGFPWHTAIIPRNRAKMITTVAGAVQNELLNKAAIKAKLAQARLVDEFIAWADRRNGKRGIAALAGGYAASAWERLEPRRVARYAQRFLAATLRKGALTPYLHRGLRWALITGRFDRLLDNLLAELRELAAGQAVSEAIYERLEHYRRDTTRNWWQRLALEIAEATNTLNLAEAAAVLQEELLLLLTDLTQPGHPVRGWLRFSLAAAVDRLGTEPAWAEHCTTWQKSLSRRLNWEEALTGFAEFTITRISSQAVGAWSAEQAEKLWDRLKADPLLRDWVEDRLKTAVGQLIDSEHNLVALVVTEALGRLNDEDLNRFIEDKAGEDLAWIRVNGSVVGGIVGLLLFLVQNFFYFPYVVPLLRSWLL